MLLIYGDGIVPKYIITVNSMIQTIFDSYKTDIENIRYINSPQLDDIKMQWDLHRSANPIYEDRRNVSPLIDAEFDQGGSWNNFIQSEKYADKIFSKLSLKDKIYSFELNLNYETK